MARAQWRDDDPRRAARRQRDHRDRGSGASDERGRRSCPYRVLLLDRRLHGWWDLPSRARQRGLGLVEPEPQLDGRHCHGHYDLQIGIYGSPEALQTLGGGDLATWVGAMYESILGRSAAASEKQYWADLAAIRGRQAVVAAIARSDEATMRRLTVYYQTFLLRGVDASGRATFLPLMTGHGDFVIPIALGGSPEYWARAQTRSY